MALTAVPAGLCATCVHRRNVETGRSVFVLCERGLSDPSYAKYPVLPVWRCAGHVPAPATPRDPDR